MVLRSGSIGAGCESSTRQMTRAASELALRITLASDIAVLTLQPSPGTPTVAGALVRRVVFFREQIIG